MVLPLLLSHFKEPLIMTPDEVQEERTKIIIRNKIDKLRSDFLLHRKYARLYNKIAQEKGNDQADLMAAETQHEYFDALRIINEQFIPTNTHALNILKTRNLSRIDPLVEKEGSIRIRLPLGYFLIVSYYEIPSFSGNLKKWVLVFSERDNTVVEKTIHETLDSLRERACKIVSSNWPEQLSRLF